MDHKEMGWESLKSALSIGDSVTALVRSHHPFGVLVAVQPWGQSGVLERIRMHDDGFETPVDYPAVGTQISAQVLGFRDYNHQIELALPITAEARERARTRPRSIEVGLRFDARGQLEFFGLEDVNAAIAEGYVVSAIEKGRALMVKTKTGEEDVVVRLNGFSVLVQLKRSLLRLPGACAGAPH